MKQMRREIDYHNSRRQRGLSLVELIIAIGILTMLMGLVLPAVQASREAARRMQCSNKVRQLALAIFNHESSRKQIPMGAESVLGMRPGQTWLAKLLPYLEQDSVYSQSLSDFAGPLKHDFSMHTHFATPIPLFACPSDSRPFEKQYARGKIVALTSYLGNAGRRLLEADGTFLTDQAVQFKDITDGLSNTILVVERPASADHYFGWWYAGSANPGSALDSLVGFAERNLLRESHIGEPCMEGPYYFRSSHLKTQCGIFHPWSLHPEGANMVFADGAIRFVAYTADNTLLIAQSTRNGGEFASAED